MATARPNADMISASPIGPATLSMVDAPARLIAISAR